MNKLKEIYSYHINYCVGKLEKHDKNYTRCLMLGLQKGMIECAVRMIHNDYFRYNYKLTVDEYLYNLFVVAETFVPSGDAPECKRFEKVFSIVKDRRMSGMFYKFNDYEYDTQNRIPNNCAIVALNKTLSGRHITELFFRIFEIVNPIGYAGNVTPINEPFPSDVLTRVLSVLYLSEPAINCAGTYMLSSPKDLVTMISTNRENCETIQNMFAKVESVINKYSLEVQQHASVERICKNKKLKYIYDIPLPISCSMSDLKEIEDIANKYKPNDIPENVIIVDNNKKDKGLNEVLLDSVHDHMVNKSMILLSNNHFWTINESFYYNRIGWSTSVDYIAILNPSAHIFNYDKLPTDELRNLLHKLYR